MRTLLGLGIVLAVVCGANAADEKKLDEKKLVGKWEPVKPKKGEAMVMEFTKDGKLTVTGDMGGKEVKIEGTYKLDGDKLTFALKFMDLDIKETVTLTKLTDDEMEGKDKDGKVESFKKVKAK
ncbi:TIGR03066 family protein [Gemmata sp. G18]|uniref:TIGR03066 family protein n=1 Tax=Gemmata palustris TaxID=2822762 RepID=A0ABS5BQW2_9BACT|nr:TIGR03066 family protein [Gemmata palustris]MBP3955258.1 TIGR03066 family protein [Gemmata palustris]